MNIMDKVVKELGIKFYDKFKIIGETKSGYYYFEKKKGIRYIDNNKEEWDTSSQLLEDILLGKKRITFVMRSGETYHFPYFRSKKGTSSKQWSNSVIDRRIQRTVGCYKTEYNALQVSKELGWYIIGDESE